MIELKEGTTTISNLNKMGIYSAKDLLEFYPFRYDIIKRSDTRNLEDGDKIIIDGVVETKPSVFYINKKLNKMTFKVATKEMLLTVTIFNRGFLKNNIQVGNIITVLGKYDKRRSAVTAHDIKLKGLEEKTKIDPVYHTIKGMTTTKIEKLINKYLNSTDDINDNIPLYLIDRYKFLSKKDSVIEMHKPSSIEKLKKARMRTKYEELFVFMLRMNYLKNNKDKKTGVSKNIDKDSLEKFRKTLPFELTKDQLTSVEDIYNDLKKSTRMNRMIQGDVGSGKTIISFIAIYMNYLAGYQSALMAPTEILAKQHFSKAKELFEKFGINICLLTGSLKTKEQKEIHSKIEEGFYDVIIGTHALISDKVVYKNLGLVITDEQHRFGVNQRSSFMNKGIFPDTLYMSATPIPRTYALTLYGDMDVSNIKTKPVGRKDVITKVRKDKDIKMVLECMYKELLKGHQIYVIAPLIEESEEMDLKNVNELYDKMNLAFGKKYNIEVLHGKQSDEVKEEAMNKFSSNKAQILISTTVVEVGVDVRNATMIVIFDAFRFGLSTLHQLRGRVGRNELDSYCVLISSRDTKRLHIMEKTNDGFLISEEDFRLRGSGDLFGQKQSGDMRFRIADIKNDYKILLKAKEDSEVYLAKNEGNSVIKSILNLS